MKTVLKKKIQTFAESPLHMIVFRELPFVRRRMITTCLDDKSIDAMFRIQESMKYLAPMYMDDRRLIWIEVLRGTPSEWCPFREAKAMPIKDILQENND